MRPIPLALRRVKQNGHGLGQHARCSLFQGLAQPVEVGLIILSTIEAGLAIMRALHEVLGDLTPIECRVLHHPETS